MARGITDWSGFWSGDAASDAAEAMRLRVGGAAAAPAATAAPAAPAAPAGAGVYDDSMKQSIDARTKLHNMYGTGWRLPQNYTPSQMQIARWITSNETDINRFAQQLNEANENIAKIRSGQAVDTAPPDASVVGDTAARVSVLPAKPTFISNTWYDAKNQIEKQYIDALNASQIKLQELLAKKEVRTIRTIDGAGDYPSSTAEFITRLDDENIEDPSKAVTTYRLINPDGTTQAQEQQVFAGTPAAAAAQKPITDGVAPVPAAVPAGSAAGSAGGSMPPAMAGVGGGKRVVTGQTQGPGGMIPTYSILPGGGSSLRESSFQFIKDEHGNGANIFDTTTGLRTRVDDVGGEVGIKQIEKTSSGVYAIKENGTRVLIRPLDRYEQDEFNAAASSANSKAASDAVTARYAEPTAALTLENMNLTLSSNRIKFDDERRSKVVSEMISEGKITRAQGYALLGKFAEFDAMENSNETSFENTRARRMEERAGAAKEIRDYQGGIDLTNAYFGGGNPQYRKQYAQFMDNLPGQAGDSQAARMYRSVSGIQGPLPTSYVDPGLYKRAEFAPPQNVDFEEELRRRYPPAMAALSAAAAE